MPTTLPTPAAAYTSGGRGIVPIMSNLLARIMLVIFMLPCAGMLYTVTFVVASQTFLRSYRYGSSSWMPWMLSGYATWLFIGIYWWLVWRREVRRNSTRVGWTVAVGAILALVGIGVGLVLEEIDRGFGWWVGSVVPFLGWLVATTFLWRESAAERAARASNSTSDGVATIPCPQCGYNLHGLSSTRCPECGRLFTLDELLLPLRTPQAELTR